MSEKAAKAARKEEKQEKKVLFNILIEIYEDGSFAFDVPKGAPIPLALDVIMRVQRKIWDLFISSLTKKKPQPQVVVPTGIPEGLLRRGQ